ncbi:MAG TPA: hypothetical protein VGC53_08535 [Vicinamibacteria bacterium]
MKVRYRSRLAKLILPKRYTAITLGSRVFTPLASLSAGTLRHERAHVEQWKRHGIARFPLLYFWYHLRHGYERNPFEMEARQEESSTRPQAPAGRSDASRAEAAAERRERPQLNEVAGGTAGRQEAWLLEPGRVRRRGWGPRGSD